MITKLNITTSDGPHTTGHAHYTDTIGSTKSSRIFHQNYGDYCRIGTMQIYLLN